MKFGLVVGNPPYNDNIYVDFVLKGHEHCTKYNLWITPAAWGSRSFAGNMRYRLMKHLHTAFCYLSCADIFYINAWGGVLHYLFDKKRTYSEYRLVNKNSGYKLLEGETKQATNLSYYSFNIFGDEVVKQFGNYKHLELDYNEDDTYFVHFGNTPSTSNIAKATGKPELVVPTLEINNNSVSCDNDIVIYSSKDKAVCDSVYSYFNTKFVRFLLLVGSNIQHPFTKELNSETTRSSLRYIPQPDAFDHIFTDEELYEKYNLTEEQKKGIESLIRKR